MISRERRYGLNAESYSALNGYVRSGETPERAALRILHDDYEVLPGELVSTGSYRIQVNRGNLTMAFESQCLCLYAFVTFRPFDYLIRWWIFTHIYCQK